jgi:hypothetical protein
VAHIDIGYIAPRLCYSGVRGGMDAHGDRSVPFF